MAIARGSYTATLADLVAGDPTLVVSGDAATVVTDPQIDSRRIRPGSLFVALRGAYFDGHDYVEQAVAAGAAAVMVDRPVETTVPSIIAADARACLPGVAARFYRHPSREIPVIGVTGTDGKTTTSYLIEHIFRCAGLTTGVIGTVSVRIGDRLLDADTRQTTPESLDVQRHLRAMVDAGVDAAIVESTSHGLALHRLDDVRFVTGAVTNITSEHLEFHQTVENYWRAKAMLFERVGESGGTSVVNLDDEGARSVIPYAVGSRILGYGIGRSDAMIRATDVGLSGSGSTYRIEHDGQAKRFETPLLGQFNVQNVLCAVGVALAHDISLELCSQALRSAPPIPGRLESVQAGQPFSVVVDYAHTPASVEKVLTLLRGLHPGGRLMLVMGSAGERDREKRPAQGRIAAMLADFSIFTSEDPRFEDADAIIDEIAAGAIEAGATEGKQFVRFTDRRDAIRAALAQAKPGDCVLLAGKGHERSIIWGLEKRPWDEGLVARELIAELGLGR